MNRMFVCQHRGSIACPGSTNRSSRAGAGGHKLWYGPVQVWSCKIIFRSGLSSPHSADMKRCRMSHYGCIMDLLPPSWRLRRKTRPEERHWSKCRPRAEPERNAIFVGCGRLGAGFGRKYDPRGATVPAFLLRNVEKDAMVWLFSSMFGKHLNINSIDHQKSWTC